MAISEVYFVLEQLPNTAAITDFHGTEYTDLRSKNPHDYAHLRTVNAQDYLRGLADVDPEILTTQSRKQLVDRLEQLAKRAEWTADGCAVDKNDFNCQLAARDNIRQIINLLSA